MLATINLYLFFNLWNTRLVPMAMAAAFAIGVVTTPLINFFTRTSYLRHYILITLQNTTGTIPQGAKDSDYPMAIT